MRENEAIERYNYRKSNLMHNYYAVNSVDGRIRILLKKEDLNLWVSLKNILDQGKHFLAKVFHFEWKGFLTGYKTIMLPKIMITTTHLIISKSYVTTPVLNGLEIGRYKNRLCNTTHK